MPKLLLSSVLDTESPKHEAMEVENNSHDNNDDGRQNIDKLQAASALTSLSRSPSPPSDSNQQQVDEITEDENSTKKNARNIVKIDDDDDVRITFPQRLMEILSNEEYSDIITWLPHGKSFIIYKKKKFAADILPLYFKQAKYTSFTRKLNRWNFTRVAHGPETGAYYHQFFQRGNLRLCMQMTCQSQKAFVNRDQQHLTGVGALNCIFRQAQRRHQQAAFQSSSIQTLNIAHEVFRDMLQVKQLEAAATMQRQKMLDMSRQLEAKKASMQQQQERLLLLARQNSNQQVFQQEPSQPQQQVPITGTMNNSNTCPMMDPTSYYSVSVVKNAFQTLQLGRATAAAQHRNALLQQKQRSISANSNNTTGTAPQGPIQQQQMTPKILQAKLNMSGNGSGRQYANSVPSLQQQIDRAQQQLPAQRQKRRTKNVISSTAA